jgi:putative intracellular protease/amidase
MRIHLAPARCVLLGTGLAALALAGCGSEPPAPQLDPATAERETQAFVDALKPRRPGRPVIVVVGLNEGTEMTDFLLPHAVLQRANLADVQLVAPRRGRVALYPALQVDMVQDLAGFDAAHPSGANYVIVPAMQGGDNPAIIAWLQRQVARGARIIGVCAGALVLGSAGLLDGRHFTTHWYYRDSALERHPSAIYVPNRRYVIDGDVATTSGVTATVPTMLALVEALGGRAKAQALAAELGVDSWSPAHDSSRFELGLRRRATYLLNKLAFFSREHWRVDVSDGMDDVALALATAAWSRTGRISVSAAAAGPVRLRSGAVIAATPAAASEPRLPLVPSLAPMEQLDRTLCEIGQRFGAARLDWVMLELEYAGTPQGCTQ